MQSQQRKLKANKVVTTISMKLKIKGVAAPINSRSNSLDKESDLEKAETQITLNLYTLEKESDSSDSGEPK